MHRLDDQWVFAYPLLDGRQLACLHQLRQLRRFFEALGELAQIRDGGWSLQPPDQLPTYLWRGRWSRRGLGERGRWLPGQIQ
jgi:hypothetical protein